MNLQQEFLESIKNGLQRKTITTCSKWAEKYRMMGGGSFPGPFSFKYHPWLRDMHDSTAELNVGQKSAQMGYTETVLNITFYFIDVKQTDCLYVLPAKTPDASNFSASRFDAALELSPHLARLFSDVKNIGHKRAGATNLYIRGSRSRSGLKSVPVGLIVLDEVDEMTQKNIPLAFERTAGQLHKLVWMLSTPTLEGEGINSYFQRSSQNHFYFRCPSCSKFIELTFPDSLKICGEDYDDPRTIETHLICTQCKNKLEHLTKPEWLANNKWIESYSNRAIKGWYISQLYSSTIHPSVLAQSYFLAQRDSSHAQEFYNSKLGLTHETKDARVTTEQLNSATGNYTRLSSRSNGLITMGVDVGHPNCHFEICEWKVPHSGNDISVLASPRVIHQDTVKEFEELDELMKNFQILFCVIDAHPERRKAYEFAMRFWGHVRLCFYVNGITGKSIHLSDAVEPTVSVDRTSWMDLSLGRFKNGSITIPLDATVDYKNHMKAPVRIYDKDRDGNPVGRYVNGTQPDHFAHARNYCEIALPLAMNLNQSQSIIKVL